MTNDLPVLPVLLVLTADDLEQQRAAAWPQYVTGETF